MSQALHKYFTTGEFAKLCRVKKQTLFHYDEIGLLSPEIKKDNGYRYYSYQQFDVFSVIQLLKEVDMSLQEIKQFLKKKTPIELIDLLKNKSREIDMKMSHLNSIQQTIQTKIALTEHALTIDNSQITLQEYEEEKFFLSNSILDCSDKEFLKSVSAFIEFSNTNKLNVDHPIGAIISKEQVEQEDYENYSYLYIKTEGKLESVSYYIKPRGLYVVAYHKGSEDLIHQTFEKMLDFIRNHHLKLMNYTYEEYILDEISVNSSDEYVTEIMMHVKRL